jgi:Zn-dependent M16 (insulinase) family peptidase
MGYTLHGSALVITGYLGTSYLWEKVRVQGGAYGGFAVFDRHSGVFDFLSYRDPNLLQTLDSYDGAARFLRELDLSADELAKGIIGTIGSMDAYQLPDAKGFTSMVRYLTGVTEADRQQTRDEVLATTPEHFKAFANILAEVNRVGRVVVMGSKDAIDAANAEQNGFLKVTKVL